MYTGTRLECEKKAPPIIAADRKIDLCRSVVTQISNSNLFFSQSQNR